ncbi:MAG: hypothetical protein AAGM67_21430, partial [Bacteroidota bacterium]
MDVEALKKSPSVPFDGRNLAAFPYWFQTLNRKIDSLGIAPVDAVEMFINHTAGEVRDFLELRSSVEPDSHKLLSYFREQLQQRYGGVRTRGQVLYEKLKAYPHVTGAPGSEELSRHMREFSDLCGAMEYFARTVPDYYFLNTLNGLREVKKKLPLKISEAWDTHRAKLSAQNDDPLFHPQFTTFCNFLDSKVKIMSIEVAGIPPASSKPHSSQVKSVRVLRTDSNPKPMAVESKIDEAAKAPE